MTSNTQAIATSARWLVLGETLSRLGNFLTINWLINSISVERYAQLSYILAIANIGVVVADAGIATYLQKALPRHVNHSNAVYNALLQIKAWLGTASTTIIVITALLLTDFSFVSILLIGIAVVLMSLRAYFEAYFRVWHKSHLEVLSKLVYTAIFALSIGAVVMQDSTLENLAYAYILSAGICAVFTGAMAWNISRSYKAQFVPSDMQPLLLSALPFTFSLAINALFNYLDAAMLGSMGYKDVVGIYAAIYKPILFITSIAGMIMSAHVPTISVLWQNKNTKALQETTEQLLRIMLFIGAGVAVGGLLLQTQIIDLLYTQEYVEYAYIFGILSWSTFAIFIWAAFGNTLQACDREKLYVRSFVYALAVNVIANYIGIYFFGITGAAVATLLTQVLLIVLMVRNFSTLNITGWNARTVSTLLMQLLVSASVLACVLLLLQVMAQFNVLLLIFIGGSIYIASALAMGLLRTSELTFFLNKSGD